MRGRQTLSSVAAHEGEADPSRRQHIGNSACRLPSEMGIEKCTTQRPALDSRESIANITCRPHNGDPRILKRRDNVEGNEELILHNENGMRVNHFVPMREFDGNITALCFAYVPRAIERTPLRANSLRPRPCLRA